MWTCTHFYCFTGEPLEAPENAAVDIVGTWNNQTHINVRWLGEESQEWAKYRVYPETPRRDFFNG